MRTSYWDPFSGRSFDRKADESEFWVDPGGPKRTKDQSPYGYSEFYLWGGPSGRKLAKDAVYSDRLRQWDHEKNDRCFELVGAKGWANMGKARSSEWMSMYLGKPVEATALAEGCNISNGYPYWIIWFRQVDPSLTKTEA